MVVAKMPQVRPNASRSDYHQTRRQERSRGAHVLHVEVSRITGDRLRMDDAVSYLSSEVRPAVERRPGSLGTSLLLDPGAGAMGFESFWASSGALVDSEDVIAASVREAARRAGGTVTHERYAVLVFEHEAPLRGGQGVRVTQMTIEPSMLSSVEDAVAWYGDTAVPRLAEASGFCAALLYADRASGRVISETVWQDPDALAAGRSAAAAGEAAAAQALNGVTGASGEYRLVFSSARPA
jgi:heme-degrading monooxygenase HmoA